MLWEAPEVLVKLPASAPTPARARETMGLVQAGLETLFLLFYGNVQIKFEDGHAAVGQLLCCALGERHHARLRHVVRRLPGRGVECRSAAHQDDPAPILLAQVGDRGPHGHERRPQVEVEHQRTVLHEQILVARLTIDHFG